MIIWTQKSAESPVLTEVFCGGADIVGECTNELGAKVASGIEDILTELHSQLPATHIIIMAILPKVCCTAPRHAFGNPLHAASHGG